MIWILLRLTIGKFVFFETTVQALCNGGVAEHWMRVRRHNLVFGSAAGHSPRFSSEQLGPVPIGESLLLELLTATEHHVVGKTAVTNSPRGPWMHG